MLLASWGLHHSYAAMIGGGRPNAFHLVLLKASRFRKSPIDMTRTPSALHKPVFSHPEVRRSLGTAGGSWKRYLSDEPPRSLFQTSPATPPHSTVKFVSHDALGPSPMRPLSHPGQILSLLRFLFTFRVLNAEHP